MYKLRETKGFLPTAVLMIYAFTTVTNEKLRKINEYNDDNKGFKRIQTLVYMYIYIQYTGKNMADNCSIAHCACTTIET